MFPILTSYALFAPLIRLRVRCLNSKPLCLTASTSIQQILLKSASTLMAAAGLRGGSGMIVCYGRDLFQDSPCSSGFRLMHDHCNKVLSKPRVQQWDNYVLDISKSVVPRCKTSMQEVSTEIGSEVSPSDGFPGSRLSRREVGVTLGAAAVLGAFLTVLPPADAAQQTLLAGRIPGLSDPDAEGMRTYRRPDAKSGGHGVGWSPIIPYSFKVPNDGWQEVPVSIADLGGTEIDLRFASSQEGNISVIVAPVLRFSDSLGDNASIEKVGSLEKVINAFGPEVIGKNVEGLVKDMEVKEYEGRKYYQYELENPHVLITATAAGNRFYLMSVSANGRQWKKFAPALKQIVSSFRVESV